MYNYFFKLKRVVKLGIRSLIEHKLRSLLTALGIIFGVSSVIAMLAIGEGASYEARQQIKSMGSHNIIVKSRKPGQSMSSSQETQRLSSYGITYEDVIRIHTLFPDIQIRIPARKIQADIRRGSIRLPGSIIGTIPWFLKQSPLRIKTGRFINDNDMDSVSNAAVLSEQTAKALFPLDYPIGQNIYLGSQIYEIVGIVSDQKAKTQAKQGTSKKDIYEVYISITAAKKRFGEIIVKRDTGSFSMEKVELHQLTLTADTEDNVLPISTAVRSVLKYFHKENDFEIVIPLELLKQAEKTKRIFSIVLGSIAAISLLVGGIGIMNIMLASVTERTREIGIRRALGATRGDITIQFLTEALLLSIAGGILGVALGVTVPIIISHFTKLTTIIQLNSLILAFSFSVFTGIVFGIYPATRAAALSPIEALRYE